MPRNENDVDHELIKTLTAYARRHATVVAVVKRRCPSCREKGSVEKLFVDAPKSRWWRCKHCGHLW
jgi:transposase-like protein